MYRTGNEKTGNSILLIPAAAGVELKEATMAAINSNGYAEPAAAKADITVVGCVQRYTDNRLLKDGENMVQVKRGTFVWNNDGTVKETDILKKCYIKDCVTVSMNAGGSCVAGVVLCVEENAVVVDMSQNVVVQADTGVSGEQGNE